MNCNERSYEKQDLRSYHPTDSWNLLPPSSRKDGEPKHSLECEPLVRDLCNLAVCKWIPDNNLSLYKAKPCAQVISGMTLEWLFRSRKNLSGVKTQHNGLIFFKNSNKNLFLIRIFNSGIHLLLCILFIST